MSKDCVTVSVEGIPGLIKNLKAYQFIKTEACKIALKRNALNVERAAKETITEKEAVDTGRLRASISTNWAGSELARGKVTAPATGDDGVGRPPGKKDLAYVVGTNVEYGPYIEHGTAKMEERPFLFPAYFMFEGQVVIDIAKIFKKDVRLG